MGDRKFWAGMNLGAPSKLAWVGLGFEVRVGCLPLKGQSNITTVWIHFANQTPRHIAAVAVAQVTAALTKVLRFRLHLVESTFSCESTPRACSYCQFLVVRFPRVGHQSLADKC